MTYGKRRVYVWPTLLLLTVSGCAATTVVPPPVLPPPTPHIVDVNHSQVRIQFPTILNTGYHPELLLPSERSQIVATEAARACGLYGRLASQEISRECVSVQLFASMSVANLGEHLRRLDTIDAAFLAGTGLTAQGSCRTIEYLYACTPADGVD